jgi:hypothetical protein
MERWQRWQWPSRLLRAWRLHTMRPRSTWIRPLLSWPTATVSNPPLATPSGTIH